MSSCKCCNSQNTHHHDHHGHDHNHDHNHGSPSLVIIIASLAMLFSGLILEYMRFNLFVESHLAWALWYTIPLLVVILPMLKEAKDLILHKDFFNEITLMLVAIFGAIYIRKYSEALGVAVFYTIGEYFQSKAVNKARSSIKALLDIRPNVAYQVVDNDVIEVAPQDVLIGSILEVRTGERVPLDGVLISEESYMNTTALTGESRPRLISKGQEVLAGMISESVIRFEVTKTYNDSTLSRILTMVQEASERKSPTEQMIRRIARYYTPLVFLLSLIIIITPMFVLGSSYYFPEWLYRGLVFLVISCPCALVISIPLGYFGGIGLGSRNGILFKGGNYLEAISRLSLLVTDKTGTMTKGVFVVQQVKTENFDQQLLLSYTASIEQKSKHPIARAIVEYVNAQDISLVAVDNIKEVAGYGLEGYIDNKLILVGNAKLLALHNVHVPQEYLDFVTSVVLVACDQKFIGMIEVADEIKEDAAVAVNRLHERGVSLVMLSGDRTAITQQIATTLGITKYHGDLLPDQKVELMQQYKSSHLVSAFIGDGINDAPVLALSDIGIAMGGLGSDIAIESADVIIQTDEPSKVATAIDIARATKSIVWQNIILAIVVKVLILAFSSVGMAHLWEAIFADVGVSLLAILNALRLQHVKLHN